MGNVGVGTNLVEQDIMAGGVEGERCYGCRLAIGVDGGRGVMGSQIDVKKKELVGSCGKTVRRFKDAWWLRKFCVWVWSRSRPCG